MPRLLLLLPSAGYRNEDFRKAADQLGIEVIPVSNYCERLAPDWGLPPLAAIPFDRPDHAVEKLLAALHEPVDAVLAVDDSGLEVAARVREALGLRGVAVPTVTSLRDKRAFRELLLREGMRVPRFRTLAYDESGALAAGDFDYPVVVKARRLNASRGVIRADSPEAFVQAVARVRGIQNHADRDAASLGILVEDYIPGDELSLEGLMTNGRLQVLALFDKPDPLQGPYFEETIYLTPSRQPSGVQDEVAREVERACRAAGMEHGPVHAEARVNGEGVWLIEVAPRSIGGLCSRTLVDVLGMSLEEVVLRHALGMTVPQPRRETSVGVMMIPVPRRGMLRSVRGSAAARAVEGVTSVVIAAKPGDWVAPPPEASSYLGFIFARGDGPGAVETSLRAAHAKLGFEIFAGMHIEPMTDSDWQ